MIEQVALDVDVFCLHLPEVGPHPLELLLGLFPILRLLVRDKAGEVDVHIILINADPVACAGAVNPQGGLHPAHDMLQALSRAEDQLHNPGALLSGRFRGLFEFIKQSHIPSS